MDATWRLTGGSDAVSQTDQGRVHTGSGASDATDAWVAGETAAREALTALGDHEPALVIVYASVRYDLTKLLAAIRSVLGAVPLVGATSTGHFRDGNLVPPGTGVAVLALTAGPYTFGVSCVEGLAGNAEAAGARLARAARAAAGTQRRCGTLLLLTDGLTPNHEALIFGIHSVFGAAVPVVGGAAGDDRRLQQTFVFHDGRPMADAAVGVWIGSDQPLSVTVGHGWQPIGLPLLVTRVDGQQVHEIGGRPASEVFDEQIRVGDTERLDRMRPGGYYSTHAFGLIEPDGSYLVRGVIRDSAGQIRTFAPLPPYSAVQVVGCDAEALLTTSAEVAERALAGRDVSLLLVFTCIARLDILGDRGPEEAHLIHKVAGSVAVFGTYTYGEFARTRSVIGYHNATVATIAL